MLRSLLCALSLAACAAGASDVINDGVELDPGPPEGVTPKLKPIDAYQPPPAIADPALAIQPPQTDPNLTAGLLTEKTKPLSFWSVEMNDYTPNGVIGGRAREAYDLLDKIKQKVLMISGFLDDHGREKTRLVRETEVLGRHIQELAMLWRDDEDLRTAALTAKRTALVLEEELRKEPRIWTHVRWAFRQMVKETATVRIVGAALAEDEPRPVFDKDGKLISAGETLSPEEIARKTAERRKRLMEMAREELRRQERKKREREMEDVDMLNPVQNSLQDDLKKPDEGK